MTILPPSSTTYGLNVGYSSVKAIAIDAAGNERITVFPSLVAPAVASSDGDIANTQTFTVGTTDYWTGDDATKGRSRSIVSRDRLYDLAFIPALVKTALYRLGAGDSGMGDSGMGISGLPASWATQHDLAKALGLLVRAGAPKDFFTSLKILAEPQGGIFSQLFDVFGNKTGDARYEDGKIGVIDFGHHTVDLCIVDRLTVLRGSMQTFQLGTFEPLQKIGTLLSGKFGRDFSAYQVDHIIRNKYVRVQNRDELLPAGWDRPLIEHGNHVASKISDAWNKGLDLDCIVAVGGGPELQQLREPLQNALPHTIVATEPQLAIARGYARWGQRVVRGLA